MTASIETPVATMEPAATKGGDRMSTRFEVLTVGIAIIIISLIIIAVAQSYSRTVLEVIGTVGVVLGLIISVVSPLAGD